MIHRSFVEFCFKFSFCAKKKGGGGEATNKKKYLTKFFLFFYFFQTIYCIFFSRNHVR